MLFSVKNRTPQHDDTYVVGIGASAGGLEAINELFDNVPDSDHLAFVVVQHLSSDYKSLLVELLAKHTHMPVEEARHRQKVEAGRVYVIPNNKEITINNGLLILAEKEFDKGPNTAIDTFFQTLATDQKEYGIAVVLSGTGTDGTRGIEAVKNCGGFVIVQDPDTAKFDGMPKSAISSGYADLVLEPNEISNQIGNYIDGILPFKTPASKKYNDCIQSILTTVFRKTGYDFMQYKEPTILRRIARRMQMVKIDGIEDYEKYIKTHDDEPIMLTREFFIGVTAFFRDKDAFATLYANVLLKIIDTKEDHEPLKVWVTACSTGQEAYTLAILIDKALQHRNKTLDVKIFASDIDKTAIEFAAKARYQGNQLLGVEKRILEEYFTETDEGWCVAPRIRKQVVFATHDILKDPPFIKNDLVTCRNLLIYLNPPLQENVLATLYFALNRGGYLFLGTSENPSLLRKGFSEIDSKWKIYQRNSDQNIFTKRMLTTGRSRSSVTTAVTARLKTDVQLAEDFRKVLADKLGYAGIYVNENYEVKEAIGNFRKYLNLPDKISSLNLLKMARHELSGILSTSLRRCLKENQSQTIKNIRVKNGDEAHLVDLFIYPPSETSTGIYTLVVLADCIVDAEKVPVPVQDLTELQKDQYVRQLEEDLRETRTNLHMAIEGLETANEELQSSNEELQSANEELQSSNEELQSLNEELHTLNTEHQLRIKELVELNDDINNYQQTSTIGQIFLDNKLRIRRFNQAAAAVVNIIEGDIGRTIEHITHQMKGASFLEDVRRANRSGNVIEKEIELQDGRVYLIRFLPYMRQDRIKDGLVISMVDISATKNLNRLIKSVFDASDNPIFVFASIRNKEGQITDFACSVANYTAYHSFGREVQEDSLTMKKDFPELYTSGLFKRYTDVVTTGQPTSLEISFVKDGKKFWYQGGLNKSQDGLVMVLSDITQRKDAEEKLRRNYNELLITKETLRDLNAQLEVKVRQRTRDLEISEERFRMVASLTNDVIWDWNFASNRLWWSDSYYELFKFDVGNPELQTHSFRLHQIHPDDRKHVEEAFNSVLQGTAKVFNIGYRYKKNNGEFAHVMDRGMLLTDDQGMPYRMIGAMVDVTRLEQSNQQLQEKNAALQTALHQFRFVNDFMPQIVWAAQPDGKYDFYNQQWYDYTGLRSNDGKDWSTVLHADDFNRAWTNWQRSLQTGNPYEIEFRMRKFDGSYRWFLARALPMRDEQGNIMKWFGTCTDIHDQKIAERLLEDKVQERTHELRMLNEKLEASNSDLMQFASVASHDLKEPLRKIHFFSSLIKDQFPEESDGNMAGYIDRISKASSRATSLINDVLSYSRLSSENLFEKIDLGQVVNEILQDLDLAIQENGAKIHLGKLPVIQAVSGQMRQLFQNIITNSLKFHKPGQPPEVTISSRVVNPDAYVEFKGLKCPVHEIRIKDEGIGFDEQYSKKIFSLFQRLNSKEKYEGTGIGLAIANKIIERHHGMIKAKSRENEGAEFIILLPEEQPEQRQMNEELETNYS